MIKILRHVQSKSNSESNTALCWTVNDRSIYGRWIGCL